MDLDDIKHNTMSQSRISWRYVRDKDEDDLMKISSECGEMEQSICLNDKMHVAPITHLSKCNGKRTILVKLELDEPTCSLNSVQLPSKPCKEENTEQSMFDAHSPEVRKKMLDLPLSPESQKKDELCSYLQLVKNCAESAKEIVLLQNRRSTRVRNLLLLTEKRNLEKKMKSSEEEEENNKTEEDTLVPDSPALSNEVLTKRMKLWTKPDDLKSNKKKRNKVRPKPILREREAIFPAKKKQKQKQRQQKVDQTAEDDGYTKAEINKIILGTFEIKTAKADKVVGKNNNKRKNSSKMKNNNNRNNSRKKNAQASYKNVKMQRNLRSKGRYGRISMKKLMQILEISNSNNKKKYKRKKAKKQESKPATEELRFMPLLDHDYALHDALDANEEDEDAASDVSFISKEIVCGNHQKENKANMDNIMLEVQIKNDGANLKKASILKEKLIFNTQENEAEVKDKNNDEKDVSEALKAPESPPPASPNLPETALHIEVETAPLPGTEEESSEAEERITLKEVSKTPELSVQTKLNNNIEKPFKKFNNGHNNSHAPSTNTITNTNTNANDSRSLYKNLIHQKQRNASRRCDGDITQSWYSEEGNKSKDKRLSHSIYFSKEHGDVLHAIYIDNSLLIVQELLITFYNQSPLGNVLGAQNMWLPKGQVQRLLLGNNGCVQKETSSNVINLESAVAYVELWTKEHKSDKRERPVCDVFVAIYFSKSKQPKPDKKVVQLENIKASSNDVRYIVKNDSRDIIVSWTEVSSDKTVTKIRCYSFESDFQTIANVMEMQSVNYLITSLHNVEDGDTLLMGFGESKTTLWNLDYGYVIASIDLPDLKLQPQTLWVKCERGFLFTLQNTRDSNLRLVAIRGMNQSCKQLTTFKIPQDYSSTRLRGVCVEHGTVVAFYENGVLCWNAQTGELLMEAESASLNYFPSFKHVIITTMGQVIVKHALSYLITV